MDEGQYGQGDGPCLTAVRTDLPVVMTIEEFRGRWPHLASAADAAGVRSFFAEPLRAGVRPVGSLNMYSARAGGLRTPDPDVVTVLTEYLNRGLTDYSATRRASAPGLSRDAEGIQLQETLGPRRAVDHATGILMATHDLTPAEALALLQVMADSDGVPLHQVAETVVAQHTAGLSGPPPTSPA